MKQNHTLVEGKIRPTLLAFVGSFLLATIMQALYGAVDLLVVGQFADSAGVSAVAIGGQVMQTVTGIILGVSTGGTVVIAQYIGARKKGRAGQAVGNVIALFIVIAIVLTGIMLVLTTGIIKILQTPVEAVEYTKSYLRICVLGIPFIVGYNGVSGILRGFGDSKTPVMFIGIACVVNILGDLLLVGGFHMGAAGAAIATVAAQGISLIIAIVYLSKKGFPVPFYRAWIGFKAGQSLRILKIGSPIAVQDGLVNISFLIITGIINTMGLTASASVGIVEKIIIFAMLVPTAFASAVSVMVAQNVGAKRMDRGKSSLWNGVVLSLICGTVICIYCQFAPETLTGLFSKDSQVIEMGALYLRTYSIDCILVALVFCMNGFFAGCGYSLFSLIHSLLATFCIRVPLSYFLSKQPDTTLLEMGMALPLSSCLSIVLCLIYIKVGKGFKDNH
ncbi:MAG: MATE family efflux transporter [Anaerovoracaceae bacterium]